MKNPKISVIVPVYNVEQYLPDCIDSILSQTFTDFELLLIDDGSPDNSGRICDEYAEKDERIRVFHKKNGGVSSARNVGLDNSRGKYVTFVDSDDWVGTDYFHSLMTNVGNADIMYFSEVWHYEDGCLGVFSSASETIETENIEKTLFHLIENNTRHNFFGYTWNKIFKSSIIRANNIRFVEGLSVSEDEVFTMDFCLKSQLLKIIYAPIYHYRYKEDGLTFRKKSAYDYTLLANCFIKQIGQLEHEPLIVLERKRVASFMINAVFLMPGILGKIRSFRKVLSFCWENKTQFPWKIFLKNIAFKFMKS